MLARMRAEAEAEDDGSDEGDTDDGTPEQQEVGHLEMPPAAHIVSTHEMRKRRKRTGGKMGCSRLTL